MVRGRGGSERGSVAVTVALAMTVLLGFAALVVDVGLNWAARTSAQTAADAAALAGAVRLLEEGPAAALGAVAAYLDGNVEGLADQPDPNWATDGEEADGEVVCWVLPDPPPDPPPGGAANCPPGSNALQVVTPPIEVDYAFAGVLGESSNQIRARAAAGAGPAAPNNCVLCLLDPDAEPGLESASLGGVQVTGGGIVVNSEGLAALLLAGVGDITADQIRVVGGFRDLGDGQLLPPPEPGGPPVEDPLAGLPTPDLLASPPLPRSDTPLSFNAGTTTLPPGIYDSVTVATGATLTLEAGVYVFTGDGLTVTTGATVNSTGGGVTIYLACADYPEPCDGDGARFRLARGGRFLASAPATGEYAGLSIFADRGNTRPMLLTSNAGLRLAGALYGASTPLVVNNRNGLRVDSLLVAGSLQALRGPVRVSYDPTGLLPGAGRPVLIR